jgi:hypothetical protein
MILDSHSRLSKAGGLPLVIPFVTTVMAEDRYPAKSRSPRHFVPPATRTSCEGLCCCVLPSCAIGVRCGASGSGLHNCIIGAETVLPQSSPRVIEPIQLGALCARSLSTSKSSNVLTSHRASPIKPAVCVTVKGVVWSCSFLPASMRNARPKNSSAQYESRLGCERHRNPQPRSRRYLSGKLERGSDATLGEMASLKIRTGIFG